VPIGASDGERIVAVYRHAVDCLGLKRQFRPVARQFGVHHATVSKLVRAADPQTPAGTASPSTEVTVPAGPALNGSHG
jgi:hypothetical protein